MEWNEQARIRCQFHFTCPQLWNRLIPTNNDRVRHCPECNQDVYLALTEADMRRHGQQGHCIAVPVAQPDGEADSEGPHWMVGNAMPPYGPE